VRSQEYIRLAEAMRVGFGDVFPPIRTDGCVSERLVTVWPVRTEDCHGVGSDEPRRTLTSGADGTRTGAPDPHGWLRLRTTRDRVARKGPRIATVWEVTNGDEL